jgi:hexosaminidase
MRTLLICQAFLLIVISAAAQTERQLNLVPMPSSVQLGTGQLRIDQSFSIAVAGTHDASFERGQRRFLAQLSQLTGIRFRPRAGGGGVVPPTLQIRVERGREDTQKLGEDESYQLAVTESMAQLSAATPLGALYGLQTFLQLVEPAASGFAAPAVNINDRPRFAWRGLLIDVSRHFIPLDVLERNLDGMAAVKMNVLHFHLSDDQGFRVESKRFPKLHTDGSDGQYYTQAELREFLDYAHDRGVRVVPEFDMPGHSRSWLVAYPELASIPGPYKIDPEPGPDAVIDPTREDTYKFLDKFVEEMGKLFPDAYFHIGGDEVSGKPWDTNAKIQEFIHAHGMKSNQDLQAYFNQRLQKILDKHHKIMVGWDEVLHPDLPKSVVVQSWRGQKSLAVAARQGYSGLLSFGYYLDLMWPASRHYLVDPMSDDAATLNAEENARILGGEGCMWSEFVTPEMLDARLWPRSAAIAERLWSPAEVKDVSSMYARLGKLSWRLTAIGLKHESGNVDMLQRMADTQDIGALRALADVVEPVKDYTRMDAVKEPWDFRAPLNRLVDAARPESDVARNFQAAVQAYIQSGYKDRAKEEEIRSLLTVWRDNDRKLRPLLQQSFLLNDVAPLSEELSTLADAGLYALDYLSRSQPAPSAWRMQQAQMFERAKAPQANLLLMVVAPVQTLVEASAGQAHGQ